MSKGLKRKRTDNSESVSKSKNTRKAARLGPIVRGDALKWKEVTLPDRMDDAEGFYGLEEIDDVEILKDENGQLTFRPKSENDIIVAEGEVAGEEWEGFDDDRDDLHDGVQKSQSRPRSIPEEPNLAVKQKPKKEKNAVKISASKTVTSAPSREDFEEKMDFSALNGALEQRQVDVTAWQVLKLSPDALAAISRLGFANPTPIQRAAIPPIKEGRDVIGKAVTGSGKTLAFGVPILERFLEARENPTAVTKSIPTAFILAPTRELAHQLSKHLEALAAGLDQGPRIATVTGGLAVVKQQRQLEHADIIIGTPGRLWEVINNSSGLIERLKQIQFLVIDEADRLLSEGHFKEVEEILDVLNRKVINETEDGQSDQEDSSDKTSTKTRQRQTLVFSATFHKGLQQKLASKQKWRPNDILSNSQSLEYLLQKLRFQQGSKPTFVDANPDSSMAENLSESILECGAMQKDLYLYSLLLLHQNQHEKQLRSHPSSLSKEDDNDDKTTRILIFTNSISTVKRLVPFLTLLAIPNTSVLPLHSSMPQKSRLRSLERFTSPTNPTDTTAILIATDVAARGLDIKRVQTVIHYHVPRSADTYVHRSGRTARASESGRSILICSPDEVGGVTRLISKIHHHNIDDTKRNNTTTKNPVTIQPMTLPASLPTQLSTRVKLAQKITTTTSATTQSRGEDAWLRAAAEDLGVDYSSDDFEAGSSRTRRGRGAGRERRRKEAASVERAEVGRWRAELKRDLSENKSLDFGDGKAVTGRKGKFLAGGAVDVESLLG